MNAKVEARLVVQALRVNTLSKLTFADSKRFDALVRDIFPGVDFKGVEYAELADALRSSAQESNLMVMETQVSIILYYYKFTVVYCESVNLIGYITVSYLLIVNSYASVHIAHHV